MWIWGGPPVPDHSAVERSIPAGVLINHGDHNLLIAWAPLHHNLPVASLESLVPLTVSGTITCRICGRRGRIARNHWLPSTESEARRG